MTFTVCSLQELLVVTVAVPNFADLGESLLLLKCQVYILTHKAHFALSELITANEGAASVSAQPWNGVHLCILSYV